MTIEITKRQIVIIVITIVTVFVALLSGYLLGYHNGKNNTISEYEKKKGDGTNFYSEEIEGEKINALQTVGGGIIYHSTPNCEAIRNGITENRAYTDSTYRMNHSSFCSKCMDEKLIKKCQIFLESDFN